MPTTVKKLVSKPPMKAPVKQAPAKPTVKPAPARAVAKPAPVAEPEIQEAEIVYEEVAPAETEEQIQGQPAEGDDSADDLIRTPTIKLPPPKPTAHRSEITGVERRDFDSGAVAMQIHLHFQDNDKDDNYTLFMPALFVENFAEVVEAPENTLPNEEGDKERGVKGNKQLDQFLRNVASGDRTAVLQKLGAIAKSQGRSRTTLQLTDYPTTFDEFVEQNAAILSGVEVIALCRPDRNAEPQFANTLRVQSLIDPAILDDPKQKVLKPFNGKSGYVLAWEQ